MDVPYTTRSATSASAPAAGAGAASPPKSTTAGGAATTPGPGAAGLLRRWANGLPEPDEKRALALLAADAVESVEHRIGPILARPLRERGLETIAGHVERNPVAAVAGAVLAAYLVRRVLA